MYATPFASEVSIKTIKQTVRLLLAVCVFLTHLTAIGQVDFKGYAFNPKAGICLGTDFQGFGAGFEFELLRNKRIISLDLYAGEEFALFDDDAAKFRQMGILFGGYWGSGHVRIQYQGGVAPTWGILNGYYNEAEYVDSKPYFTFGLTGKLGLKLMVSHFMSLGVDIQGNLNPKNPVFYPSLSIEIGRLKERNKLPGNGKTGLNE